ncbi:hypothetical protein Bca52824_016824 [Brassica carinata]|uniref:Tyrosine decarboxylase n=1 Tax=Brassica carinata TaxID=52824 RepID=A0A8X7W564_BRACI|nr:hypothetical protein Bca52824_016824 [Brassica carinata]
MSLSLGNKIEHLVGKHTQKAERVWEPGGLLTKLDMGDGTEKCLTHGQVPVLFVQPARATINRKEMCVIRVWEPDIYGSCEEFEWLLRYGCRETDAATSLLNEVSTHETYPHVDQVYLHVKGLEALPEKITSSNDANVSKRLCEQVPLRVMSTEQCKSLWFSAAMSDVRLTRQLHIQAKELLSEFQNVPRVLISKLNTIFVSNLQKMGVSYQEDELSIIHKLTNFTFWQRTKESFTVFFVTRENGSSNALKPMDSEQLREYGHRMVDFIADYYKAIETFPVLSQVQPGYLHNLLPESAPDHPETVQQVLDDVKAKILPGVTHWQSPSFFAYFPINGSVAGFLGEMLSAGLNTMSFSWVASPAATELEIIVLDWVAKLLNLPEQFLSKGNGGGVLQGSACEAILVVMIAAREKVLRSVGKKALPKLVVYSSDQTHSSLQKACQIAGIHLENCRVLKTDSSTNYALRPESLQEAVSVDLDAGLIPFFLCGTVGTTSSTAVDPLAALGKIAKSNEMWFHVDAAYAGSACICPEYRQYIDGVETADSFDMNAHKWLLTNFECSLLWVKDQSALTEALSTNPEYLKNKASQANLVVDYKDWQIPLGRRFRSLKLWMVLRLYGAEILKSYIRNHIKLAKDFEQLVSKDSNFEVVTPRIFSLVCFRIAPVDNDEKKCNSLNRSLLDAVNSSGKLFISHTALSGKFVLRCAIGAPLTEEKHVKEAWKVIKEEASYLLSK